MRLKPSPAAPPAAPLLWRPADVAEAISCDLRTVYRMIEARQIPSCRIGRRVYVPQAFVAAKSQEALDSVQSSGEARA